MPDAHVTTQSTHHALEEGAANSRPDRRGFVLPLVVIAMILVALLAGTAQSAAWRATRAARQAWNGERALLAADEAIARTIAGWNAETFAMRAIGNRTNTMVSTATGENVAVSTARTQPLAAFIEADAGSQTAGAARRAHRRVGRAVLLVPPLLPHDAALVALSPLRLTGTAFISGRDDAGIDECGPFRDTSSVAGIHALTRHVDSTTTVIGASAFVAVIDSTRDIATFNAAWPLIASRATPRPSPLATALTPAQPNWRAIIVGDTASLTLSDTVAHEGLLAIDGDVVITGALRVRGLLVVRGSIDASIGRLDVQGAMVVRSATNRTTSLGGTVTLQYTPCAVARALAAVATPSSAPFRLWSER